MVDHPQLGKALDRVQLAQIGERSAAAVLRHAVDLARECGGTWLEIGAVLGITKQGAHKRFGKGSAPDRSPEHNPNTFPHPEVERSFQ